MFWPSVARMKFDPNMDNKFRLGSKDATLRAEVF